MENYRRQYPLFSACGLNCGLCPRYHTDGKSRCPGCAGEGFSTVHPSCGVLSCCRRKNVEYCFLCGDYPCKKYDGADLSDSFITHKNQLCDLDKAKRIGMVAYEIELDEKVRALGELLNNYDDGRRKSLYCVAVNLLDLPDVKAIMKQLNGECEPEMPVKSKAAVAVRLIEGMAEKRAVSLQLRKKAKAIAGGLPPAL